MEKLLIINGSPRAARSNSKKYAELFLNHWEGEADTYAAVSRKHQNICADIGKYDHLLFVFPLYADAIPAVLINFLKELEHAPLSSKTTVHVLINCGFLEPEQNDVAVEILRNFCNKHHLNYGMTLQIAAGEAILTTPFAFLVKRKIRKLAAGIRNGKKETLTVSMPLTKKMFLRASSQYWINYGKKYNTTEEQMRTLQIEDN